MAARWAAFKHARVWMAVTCATHLPPYIWCCSEEFPPSAPRLFIQVLFRFCHHSSIPLKCLKNQENRQAKKEWWAVFKTDWNWTLSLESCLIFFHFSLLLWYHCNNAPLAGTLCCLCVMWVMCCNPPLEKNKNMNMNIQHWSDRASVKKILSCFLGKEIPMDRKKE